MIAVDTNILVYAHRAESPHFRAASERLKQLAESRLAWAIPWPCLHEFFAIVTHARIFDPPTPLTLALDQVEKWRESPGLIFMAEAPQHWRALEQIMTIGQITGPRVHDARIAAICQENGVSEFWSADRDFSRFPALRTVNPLIR